MVNELVDTLGGGRVILVSEFDSGDAASKLFERLDEEGLLFKV